MSPRKSTASSVTSNDSDSDEDSDSDSGNVRQSSINAVVKKQPGAGDKAPAAAGWRNSPPPGLGPLEHMDRLFIKEEIELFEVICGCETANRIQIINPMGQVQFHGKEKSWCFVRQCCGSSRPFTMEISDLWGEKVLYLRRPLRCSNSCCCPPCCLQRVNVEAPKGVYIGRVRQINSCIKHYYSVDDENGERVLRIKGPCCNHCRCACCGNINYTIQDVKTYENVGVISKTYGGIMREMFTDADNFGVTFPKSLDVKIKAVLLGAAVLINFMFYENNQKPEVS